MTTTQSLVAFTLAAGLLTITPGLDTALVLRTAAAEGARRAAQAAAGILCGCLVWGALAALGVGAVSALSGAAYELLRAAGAAYLFVLGLGLLRAAWRGGGHPRAFGPGRGRSAPSWFLRGLLTNLLNPKVGVFYATLLPQFVPAGAPVTAMSLLLAAIHAAEGALWFAALILAVRPLGRWLRRPAVVGALDALTGALLLFFGLRLALDRVGGR